MPMFLGAMIMGPLAAWLMKKVDAIWDGKIKPGLRDAGQQLLRRHPVGGVWRSSASTSSARSSMGLSTRLGNGVNWLIEHSLLPLASIIIEPAKVLFLNNAINHGVLTPLGINQSAETGQVDPVPAGGQPRPGPRCC